MPSANDPMSRLLDGMLRFHNHFRAEHAMILRGIPASQSSPKVSLLRLLQQALQLCGHLEMHHSIEEAHIFPKLAGKIPSFAHGAAHIDEHAVMHAELQRLESYANKVVADLRSSPGKRAEQQGCGQPIKDDDGDATNERKPWPTTLYDEQRLLTLVNAVAAALFPHLEAEEASLKPDNLRRHGFTLQDMGAIMM